MLIYHKPTHLQVLFGHVDDGPVLEDGPQVGVMAGVYVARPQHWEAEVLYVGGQVGHAKVKVMIAQHLQQREQEQ